VRLNHANQITILRILLIVPLVICMLRVNEPVIGTTMRYVSLILLLLMAFSDAYDGYVARKKQQTTLLGSFLDPMADKLLVASSCLLLTIKSTAIDGFRLPLAVTVLIIGKDVFLLLGFIVLYLLTLQVKIIPALTGKIAIVLQIAMIGAILIAPDMTKVFAGWSWFLRLLILAVVVSITWVAYETSRLIFSQHFWRF
jgi:cardiolipin synthase